MNTRSGPTEGQRRGAAGEDAALAQLQAAGLKLVTRNFHCRHGEVDLVMLDHQMLVFVEVRTRTGPQGADAVTSVGIAKQQRLLRAAAEFLARHPDHARRACRFDVVGFQDQHYPHDGTWIRSAFEAG